MPAFEKHLSVWVALAILVGVGLGQVAPELIGVVAGLEYGAVNFIVAVLIRAMVYPMMVGWISPRSPASMNGPRA